MKKKDIVVVIPIYRNLLSRQENVSLRQCVSVLGEYSLTVIKPASLDLSSILICYPMLKVEEFPDYCFSNLRSYNKLVLDEEFYRRFSSYKYLLIHQLDAYVFRDELLDWANKGYDYIGAPWLPLQPLMRKRLIIFKRLFYRVMNNSLKLRKWKYIEYEVGNGGLSLRKVEKMLKITHFYKTRICLLLAEDQPFYPEDVLLFVEIRKWRYRLKTPNYKEALRFSLEVGAEWAYKYNASQLPFGCHAWYHKDYYPFWSQIIKYD